jgi:hypothetical protein
VRVEVLTPAHTWVHGQIVDATTARPTLARLHFRAVGGRYLPPYSHRHEVNDNWFEDYGGDLKLGSTQCAYVDGQFQVELPVGEIYVEIAKGFEYRPVRQRLTITPAQRELVLPLERPLDWRSQGWVTADTHVHFISPQTAWLEAQAEGVNLVNLLASQWGDLFTFANWARAVRAGRTFTPSGLPIGLSVERRVPGDEIVLPTAGTLHAEAWVQSVQPFDELQVIVNGQIAARQPAAPAGQETRLAAPFRLPGSAWVAARCVSHHKVWHGWPITSAPIPRRFTCAAATTSCLARPTLPIC